jgi:hypothetical protein
MEASQHSLLAACFTLHSINATLAIVPQREVAAITLALARVIASVTGCELPVIVLRRVNQYEFDILCPCIVANALFKCTYSNLSFNVTVKYIVVKLLTHLSVIYLCIS